MASSRSRANCASSGNPTSPKVERRWLGAASSYPRDILPPRAACWSQGTTTASVAGAFPDAAIDDAAAGIAVDAVAVAASIPLSPARALVVIVISAEARSTTADPADRAADWAAAISIAG